MAEASQQRLEVIQKEQRAAPLHPASPTALSNHSSACDSAQARWAKMTDQGLGHMSACPRWSAHVIPEPPECHWLNKSSTRQPTLHSPTSMWPSLGIPNGSVGSRS